MERLTDLRIYYRGAGDFVATYLVNSTPCSSLVLGGPLDTGSCPSVVDDRYWFPS